MYLGIRNFSFLNLGIVEHDGHFFTSECPNIMMSFLYLGPLAIILHSFLKKQWLGREKL